MKLRKILQASHAQTLAFADYPIQVGQDIPQRDLVVYLVQTIPKLFIGFNGVSKLGNGFPRISDFGRNVGGGILFLLRLIFDFATCEKRFELSEVPTDVVRLILIESRGASFASDWHNMGSHFFGEFGKGLRECLCKGGR